MLTGILLLSMVVFIGVISYKRPRLIQKIIKNIPLIDWINILVLPIFVYIAVVSMVINIAGRVRVEILDFEDVSLLSFGMLFLIYAFVGESIHFTSKVLSRYIRPDKDSIVYEINETFHGRLSHYLGFVCIFLVLFVLCLFEINHPLFIRLDHNTLFILFFAGCLVGLSFSKAVYYTNEWFGGYNKPLFFLATAIVFVLYLLFKSHGLNFTFYPVNFFIIISFTSFLGAFIARQVFIFTKLSKKRRLRFLARILSA